MCKLRLQTLPFYSGYTGFQWSNKNSKMKLLQISGWKPQSTIFHYEVFSTIEPSVLPKGHPWLESTDSHTLGGDHASGEECWTRWPLVYFWLNHWLWYYLSHGYLASIISFPNCGSENFKFYWTLCKWHFSICILTQGSGVFVIMRHGPAAFCCGIILLYTVKICYSSLFNKMLIGH